MLDTVIGGRIDSASDILLGTVSEPKILIRRRGRFPPMVRKTQRYGGFGCVHVLRSFKNPEVGPARCGADGGIQHGLQNYRTVKINEIHAKSILSPSQVYDYVVNPYVGCQHACTYCYARFMKRFTGHQEPWGDFVDVKVNGPDLLSREIQKKKKGTVWVSGVCDPYQPLEAKYQLTRRCLSILVQHSWPVVIQTRSALVLRDIDIITQAEDIEAWFSITTANDEVRKAFEPRAPSIRERLRAVESLHQAGIRTCVMIAPMLPEAENLVGLMAGKVDCIMIDRINYHHADWVYRKHGWSEKNTDEYFAVIGARIAEECRRSGIDYRSAY